MAAYQANYGFAQEGDPDAGAAAAKPVAAEAEKRPAVGEKTPQEPGSDLRSEQPTSADADGKRKGEKRKADPGKGAERHRREHGRERDFGGGLDRSILSPRSASNAKRWGGEASNCSSGMPLTGWQLASVLSRLKPRLN